MLRISKETDYGIMVLGYLATHPRGQIHTARRIADWSGLSVPMVSKILRSLARESIVASHRGASGGYSLEKPAHETSVAQVIRVLEGPISLVQCGSEPGVCERERGCPTRVNWNRISLEVEQALERIPITEMLGRERAPLLSLGDSTAPAG